MDVKFLKSRTLEVNKAANAFFYVIENVIK
jgi:hypothetical protein